jgi:hypothetical protein
MASLGANVAVADPTVIARIIAAWPSFALIGAYEMLMGQIRQSRAAQAAVDDASDLPFETPSDHEEEGPGRRDGQGHSGTASAGLELGSGQLFAGWPVALWAGDRGAVLP